MANPRLMTEVSGYSLMNGSKRSTSRGVTFSSTLVVRLHQTLALQSTDRRKSTAEFRSQAGMKLGFTVTRETEGNWRLHVYCEPDLDGNSRRAWCRHNNLLLGNGM